MIIGACYQISNTNEIRIGDGKTMKIEGIAKLEIQKKKIRS